MAQRGRVATPMEGVAAWEQAALRQVEALRAKHAAARRMLEADIESHPLEPQMSGQVMELMRMEESAGRQGQTGRLAKLTQRVNNLMRQETRGALNHIIELHRKQRSGVYKKLLAERVQLRETLAASLQQHARTMRVSLPPAVIAPLAAKKRRKRSKAVPALPQVSSRSSRSRRSSANHDGASSAGGGSGAAEARAALRKAIQPSGDFAQDEAAHRRQTAEHWAEGEKFNLRTAFDNQIARIKSDWAQYLRDMESEYRVERARMLGENTPVKAAGGKGGEEGEQAGHWLAKEKQDTLIHTAPVLSPNTNQSFAAAPRKKRGGRVGMSSAAMREVKALDGRFEEAKRQVLVQQAEAVRWTQRQSERMISQVGAQEVERQQAEDAAFKQNGDFTAIAEAIRAAAQAFVKAVTRHQGGAAAGEASASQASVLDSSSGRTTITALPSAGATVTPPRSHRSDALLPIATSSHHTSASGAGSGSGSGRSQGLGSARRSNRRSQRLSASSSGRPSTSQHYGRKQPRKSRDSTGSRGSRAGTPARNGRRQGRRSTPRTAREKRPSWASRHLVEGTGHTTPPPPLKHNSKSMSRLQEGEGGAKQGQAGSGRQRAQKRPSTSASTMHSTWPSQH